MRKSPFTTFLIQAVIVFGFALSGWFAWLTAFRLWDYEIMHGLPFRFLASVAVSITEFGEITMVIGGAVLGIIAALWITRRRVSDDEHHTNAA